MKREGRSLDPECAHYDVTSGVEPSDVSNAINPELDRLRAKLLSGYPIEMGGSV